MDREAAFAFLEAQTPIGRLYEKFTGIVICLNVIAFIASTVFVEKYYPFATPFECDKTCDALWFGNDADNDLSFLQIGATSLLELITVALFTIEYAVRLWTADLEDARFAGFKGRLHFMSKFDSMVDLASILPFYLDAFILHGVRRASQFVRMFRLIRMLRIEGRYDLALCLIDDVLKEQQAILGTALFVGSTTWLVVSSLYYLAERRNTDMIYCGAAPYCEDAVDTSLCTIDDWGFVNCTEAGCPPTDEYPEPCYNLFRSIPTASYLALLNLFGEFPMISTHSAAGKVVGTVVAVIAVAFFALPAGIIGSGFEDIVSRRKEERDALRQPKKTVNDEPVFVGEGTTLQGQIFNFFHAQTSFPSVVFEYYTSALVIGTTLTFMLDTVSGPNSQLGPFMEQFELVSAIVFTVDYILKIYSIIEDPKYGNDGPILGRLKYAKEFFAIVDLLSILPFWINAMNVGSVLAKIGAPFPSAPALVNVVKSLRLLRLLKFERYTKAFTTFDDIIKENIDVLAVTGYSALLLWIFFSALLYYTERDNPDVEMASYYNTVPRAMWVTLLNLSGESPLSNYSTAGKVTTGIIGLFASGLFGIPVGILGAGFEELATEEEDNNGQDETSAPEDAGGEALPEQRCSAFELACFHFVNGVGSKAAEVFDQTSYVFIMLSVCKGIVQTLPGYEDFLRELDWVILLYFTLEYALRFIGATADPQVGADSRLLGLKSRVRFLFSFFSIIDLLSIVPFYYANAMPGSWVDDHAVYLRMFRLLRLLKLEKYFPSITLIDDVFRLKKNAMIKTCFAAGTLWIFFAALLYLAENQDFANGIDPVPLYGCELYSEHFTTRKKRRLLGIPMGKKRVVTDVLHYDCTMSNRFTSFFDSLVYAGVHLTGDFPIITYNSFGRVICFFIVIAAVGVVSIPAGLIANGFSEIVEGRVKGRRGKVQRGNAGDDWYEFRLAELRGQDPPPSRFGPLIDQLQTKVHEFLNGKTLASVIFRWLMFTVISVNVLAVVLESIPEVDQFVGDKDGNFFSRLETFSVLFFAAEYGLRLFSASKSVEALYSPWVYATTFFGIVDIISIAPWFVQNYMQSAGMIADGSELGKIFSVMRIFRILQIEGLWNVAFSKLDNVFRASKDVLKATGLMALIVWIGCSALFFLFEENNPNWRECDASVPLIGTDEAPGCYDFPSTSACNEYYPGLCSQAVFSDLPSTMFYTAVFLVGEWGLVDFSFYGRIVCLFLCVAGIGLYAIPIGSLFDSFGAVIGMGGDDDDDEFDDEKEKDD